MDRLPDANELVTLGVDTHADPHVAAALDSRGRLLDTLGFPPNQAGFSDLVAWASQFGTIDRIGVEGTGSYGAGLARWLRHQGLLMIEVNRPDRSPYRDRRRTLAGGRLP